MSQREMNDAEITVKNLCAQDDSQLKEMYHDILDAGGVEVLERMQATLDEFLSEHEEDNEPVYSELPGEYEEWKQIDDAQRAREARELNKGKL